MKDNHNSTSQSSKAFQREIRINHLYELKRRGFDPYPARSKRDYTLYEIKSNFDNLLSKYGHHNFIVNSSDLSSISDDPNLIGINYSKSEDLITIAGRLKSKRVSGKIAFGTIEDESLPTGFQSIFKLDILGSANFYEANFRAENELISFHNLTNKIKTIETRVLNPDEKERYFGNIQKNDLIKFRDLVNNQNQIFRVTNSQIYQSIDEAFQKGLEFEKVFGKKFNDVKEVKEEYLKIVTPEYLNRMQTIGFVAFEVESVFEETKTLDFGSFKDLIDEGDYLQLSGYLDRSKSGEPSLFVTEYKILTKSLLPLPESIDSEDLETRYLDRVADFKLNTKDDKGLGIRDIMVLKTKFWNIWRDELVKEGFLEVETPTLELVPGGAEAKTFETYYEEMESEVHLRISPELSLKKLMAGGFEKVFEIGKNFRNEGSSPQHLQEYTAIEWYCAYKDYNYGMSLVQRIYRRIVLEVLGNYEQIDYYGNSINWNSWCDEEEAKANDWGYVDGWPVIKYFDAVRYFSDGKIDTENKSITELVTIAKNLGINEANEKLGVATLLDKIWKKARVNTRNPFFLVLPPVELEPLAKRSDQNSNLTERFQLVAGTAELGKGFSELNDPIDQLSRFEVQQKARDDGNSEAQFMNADYVHAMEYGMPPMAGFGASERFFSFLLSKHIKETVTFPFVKVQNQVQKSERTMVCHCLILDDPKLALWEKLNTAAHLSASLAARIGKPLIELDRSTTKDDVSIPMNIRHAIIMKKVATSKELYEFKQLAEADNLTVSIFTEEMKSSSNDQIVAEKHKQKKAEDIGWLGVMIYGRKNKVEELTNALELFE
jgi:lysyl-tRNA synthetase class 2